MTARKPSSTLFLDEKGSLKSLFSPIHTFQFLYRIPHLVPYTQATQATQAKVPRRLGEAKGLIEIKPDFDQLPDEFMAHFT